MSLVAILLVSLTQTPKAHVGAAAAPGMSLVAILLVSLTEMPKARVAAAGTSLKSPNDSGARCLRLS
jgi:hypothetical protein